MPKHIRILDIKTGRVDADASQQLRAYAWLALQENPDAESVYACVIRVRDQIVDGFEWTREQLAGWWDELSGRLLNDRTFRPGSHCGYCPRGATCPGKAAALSEAIASMGEVESLMARLPSDPAERGTVLAQLLERAKLVEKTATMARELVKADVKAHGGMLPLEDGRVLLIDELTIKKINAGKARQLLVERGIIEPIEQATFYSKEATEKAIKATAPRGAKDAAYRQLLTDLEGVGAIIETHQERLELHLHAPAEITTQEETANV